MTPLLDFKTYQELGGTAPEDKFAKLEQDAEDLINPRSGFFYLSHSIDTDPDKERVYLFRKALTLQINYSSDIGASTPYEMSDKDVKSVSVDGTTVTKGTTPTNFVTNGVYNLANDYLYKAGLLYRGVPYA